MYTFDSRVRYSEIDENRSLSVTAVINYMQDCSTFQSEDMRVGVQALKGRGKAWLLSSWRILIDRYPLLGEKITISTWHCGSRGIYGFRNFRIRDSQGRDAVRASSVWFLYDLEKGCPVRVREEDTACYGVPEPPLDLGEMPRKLVIPKQYEERPGILISRHHLDTNHHVNNARYVEMAVEQLPEVRRVWEIRTDYKKAAHLGKLVIPRITEQGNGQWMVTLCDEDGGIYAAVWMKTDGEG